MRPTLSTCGLLGGLLAAVVTAGPVVVRTPDIEAVSLLQERIPSIPLGNFDLTTSHQNDVLFNIGYGTSAGRVGDASHLEVVCVDCRTWGSVDISTGGVNKNDDIIGDIISFFENPVDAIIEAFDLNVKIDFTNVGGHFDFRLFASETVSYSFPIFQTQTMAGAAISEDVSVGLVLTIDLVFSLTAAIDLEAGFEFAFPEGAYITVDPISGNIVDHGFTAGEIQNLPVIVTAGSATFKAALRVRVQAGTTVELFGTGFDFELGVYADLIEYVATIGTSDTCELYITESVDVNIGAYAHAVIEIDYKTFGASPAIVTTLLDYPLPSLCLTRPAETGLPTLPSVSVSIVTSGDAALSTPAIDSATLPAAVQTSFPVIETAAATVPGGAFAQSSSATPSTTTFAISASPTPYGNSTITAAASMTTSTVISTDYITITSCASAILHCPASLTTEIIITSTKILYTTICPIGKAQPTTLPSFKPTLSIAASPTTSAAGIITHIISPFPLTPCATPHVETIYTPTFVNPTYAMPTATAFTVPHPEWNVTQTATSIAVPIHVPTSIAEGETTITVAPTYSPLPSPSAGFSAAAAANSTVLGSVSPPQPTTTVPFTGTGARLNGDSVLGLVVLVGVGILAVV